MDDLGASDGLLRLRVVPAGGRNLLAEVARHAHGKGWQVQGLHIEHGRLEDVFREATTRGAAAGSAT